MSGPGGNQQVATLKITVSIDNRGVINDGGNSRDRAANGQQDRSSCLRNLSARVDNGISEFFRREGAFVARHPFAIIFACILATALLSMPLFDFAFPGKGPVPFIQENDKDRLYAPADAPSFKDREYVEATYGYGELLSSIVLISKDKDNPNVLSKEHLLEAMDVWDAMINIKIDYEGREYDWEDVCQRNKPNNITRRHPCKEFSVLDVWQLNKTLLEMDPDPIATLTSKTVIAGDKDAVLSAMFAGAVNAYGAPLYRSFVLGTKGIITDTNGRLVSADVFRFSLFKKNEKVDIQGKLYDPIEYAWESALVETLVHKYDGPLLQAYVGSFYQVDKESEEQVNSDTFWVILSYTMVIVASHIVLFRNNRAFCKMHLTSVSIAAISMAILASIGLVNIMGVPYNLVVRTVPFLLVGLGMDDTFVIMGAYSLVPNHLSVEQRISETMKQAGSSIMVTSLTDFVAFTVGTFAKIPAVQAFCLYAAVGVMFDFIFQVTFFVAFVALDSVRENRANEGYSNFGLSRKKKTMQGNTMEVPQMQAMISTAAAAGHSVHDTVDSEKIANQSKKYPRWFGKGNFDPNEPSFARRIIGERLPAFTLSSGGKALVVLIEIIAVGLAVYGCSKVYMDFRYKDWFVPKGHWLKDAFDIEDQYFGGEQIYFGVFTRAPVDGRNYFYHQSELEALGKVVETSPHISHAPIPPSNWYSSFMLWARARKATLLDETGHPPNATIFTTWVKEFIQTDGRVFEGSVVFSKDNSHIISTKIFGFTRRVEGMKEYIASMDALRSDLLEVSPQLQAFPYGFIFPFLDSFRFITWETIQNVVSAGAAVFVICLVVLADFVTTLCVVFMIALTDVWLFGFMHYLNLQFNIVTAINIILAVGIAVDYSSHVAHSFLVVQGSRKERAQKALYHIGGEVFSGAFTTLLAVLGLGMAKHYIFSVFFKMFVVIIVGGLWHGLIILPVLLSMIGSEPYHQI